MGVERTSREGPGSSLLELADGYALVVAQQGNAAVRLVKFTRELGQALPMGDADRGRHDLTQVAAKHGFNVGDIVEDGCYPLLAGRNTVQLYERLVDREDLNRGRERFEDAEHRLAPGLVGLVVGRHNDEFRADPDGVPARHGRLHAA